MQEIQFRSGLGRFPGKGNGYPLQHSCLENSMDRAWRTTVHGVTKSWTRQRDSQFFCLTMDVVFVDYEGSLLPHFISIPLDIHQSKYVISKYTRCSEINHLVKKKILWTSLML